jgi:hypothetical protein
MGIRPRRDLSMVISISSRFDHGIEIQIAMLPVTVNDHVLIEYPD